MVVKIRKQGNSITIPSGVKSEELGQQVSYVSDDAFDLNVDKIFDRYDDVFKALLEKYQYN